ncbi:MAG: hypothetical protein U1A77_08070 [Pirellulales bacterium]
MIQFTCPKCKAQSQSLPEGIERWVSCSRCGANVETAATTPSLDDNIADWLSLPKDANQSSKTPSQRDLALKEKDTDKKQKTRDLCSPVKAPGIPTAKPSVQTASEASSDDEYTISPEAPVRVSASDPLSAYNLSEPCDYCGRKETSIKEDRLWCAWCDDWGKHRSTQGRKPVEEDLFREAMTGKVFGAWVASMATTAFVGPVAGHEVFEKLSQRDAPKPPSPAQELEHKEGKSVCRNCGIIRENPYACTCRSCGNTEWSPIYIAFGFGACLSLSALIALLAVEDAVIGIVFCVTAGFLGMMCAMFAISQVLISKRSQRTREIHAQLLAKHRAKNVASR